MRDVFDCLQISQTAITASALCNCCNLWWPAGTVMVHRAGISDGEHYETNCCPACEFATAQPKTSALHLCWGWDFHGEPEGMHPWEYIRECLEDGETPTEEGYQRHLAWFLDAEEE